MEDGSSRRESVRILKVEKIFRIIDLFLISSLLAAPLQKGDEKQRWLLPPSG